MTQLRILSIAFRGSLDRWYELNKKLEETPEDQVVNRARLERQEQEAWEEHTFIANELDKLMKEEKAK